MGFPDAAMEIFLKSTTSAFHAALLVTVISAVAVMPVAAAARETTAATKTRMIQLIGNLESEPFLKDGEEVRNEILTWLAEAPDVSVKLCPKVLGDFKKIKGNEGSILVVQLMFSEAKFILEHPDKATDQHAINVAGVEGVLKTYAAMQAVKPKLAIPELDRLVQLQASGQLGTMVDEALAKCG